MADGEDEAIFWHKAMIYGILVISTLGVRPLLMKCRRTRGTNIVYQLVFIVAAMAAAMLTPNYVGDVLFSEAGVLIMGTLIPVYQSIIAVCTVGEADDTIWLQFWIVNATFTYATEFIDTIKETLPNGGEHWYEFEFILTIWLMLPFTDGASLVYDKFTEPFVAPICKGLKKKMEGWYSVIAAVINGSYMWIVWFTFMSLPEPARRFVVVAVGTVYPIVASTVAITTDSTGLDDTYWLTYWACFNIVFILMDYLETWVGSIKGFYSICLVAVVYLFLPMFEGSKVVFRRILVPLSGQQENMLLHDAYLVRRDVEAMIPDRLHSQVMPKLANIFAHKKKE